MVKLYKLFGHFVQNVCFGKNVQNKCLGKTDIIPSKTVGIIKS